MLVGHLESFSEICRIQEDNRDILSEGGMPSDGLSELVSTNGTCPLRRMYTLLQGYRGEGWIFPRSPRFRLAVWQGVS